MLHFVDEEETGYCPHFTFVKFPGEVKHLRPYLSLRTYISLESSNFIKLQDQEETASIDTLIPIGTGACGEVFMHYGLGTALKRPHSGKELEDEVLAHQRIYAALARARITNSVGAAQVPKILSYHSRNDTEWWTRMSGSRAPGMTYTTDLLTTQRIMPLPKQVREALIKVLCHPHPLDQAMARKKKSYQHFLVRILLGSRIPIPPRTREWKGLRDYEADITVLESLGADILDYAQCMGVSMACVHFGAKMDARGVEFVLGTAPDPEITSRDQWVSPQKVETRVVNDFKRHLVSLWLIDFDECRPIELTEGGMNLAVSAFYDSEPFCPRPVVEGGPDRNLWDAFERGYMSKALDLRQDHLARYFCKRLFSKMKELKRKALTAESSDGDSSNGEVSSDPVSTGKPLWMEPRTRGRSKGNHHRKEPSAEKHFLCGSSTNKYLRVESSNKRRSSGKSSTGKPTHSQSSKNQNEPPGRLSTAKLASIMKSFTDHIPEIVITEPSPDSADEALFKVPVRNPARLKSRSSHRSSLAEALQKNSSVEDLVAAVSTLSESIHESPPLGSEGRLGSPPPPRNPARPDRGSWNEHSTTGYPWDESSEWGYSEDMSPMNGSSELSTPLARTSSWSPPLLPPRHPDHKGMEKRREQSLSNFHHLSKR